MVFRCAYRLGRTARHGDDLDVYPDVVVLDYRLPGKNGLEIYREIVRNRARSIGCVMITGCPLEDITQSANELGIDHLLCKPFVLSELQRLIDRSAEKASRTW